MTVFVPKPSRLFSGLLVVAAILCAPAARAGSVLWFNGSLDQRDALANQTGAVDGLIYDDFIVPTGFTYTITGVFSQDAMYNVGAASTAYWEIRSGVSAGNGGTLLASGDGNDALTYTGNTLNTGGLAIPVYTNEVFGMSVTLSAGTYWLAVAPDVSNQNSYITTT